MNPIPGSERKKLLGDLFLFQDIDLNRADGHLDQLREMRLSDGEVLFVPNEHNDAMYLILEGRLQVHLESPDSTPITVLEAGDSVGELSVIDSLETSAYVTAQGECRLAVMDQVTLWTLINDIEGFARNLLYVVSRRVRHDNERMVVTRQRQRQWEHYATVDALTGLHNRRWLNETFGRQLERSRRSDSPLALIMLDVDHFKAYNDTEGHVAGDTALMALATVLRSQLRPTDHAARFGGEEFSVLLPQTDRLGAVLVAERLRAAVSEMTIRTDEGLDLPRITISLGLTELRQEDTVQTMLERSDQALYQAKEAGRNRVASL